MQGMAAKKFFDLPPVMSLVRHFPTTTLAETL
jgi:hypothetical protein